MNIFDMAGQNAENLRRNYSMLEDRCENQNDLDIVREFANLVEDV